MSYYYYTGTEKGSTYQKYRARLGIDTSDSTSSTAIIKWIGQAQSTQIAGYGIKVEVDSSGDTSGYSGLKSGSDTGVVSSSKSFETDASTSGTLKIPRGHSEKEVKITATVSGVTVNGHSKVPNGTSTVSHTVSISALASYTVKYNANGGTGAPDSQTKYYGETLKLRTGKPTRSGYTFVGWGLSASDTAKNYDPGDSYTKNSGDTLYAIWKKTITLSYNANGGSGAPSSSSYTVYNATTSHTFTVTSVKPTRTGYIFQGWSKSSSATTYSYASGGSISLSASDTLYAVWKINSYTVTYNYNYSGSTSTIKSFTYNSNITLPTPTRKGYTFLGWYTASSGGTKLTTSYKVTSSIIIYAQWKVATVSGTIYTLTSSENKYKASTQVFNVGADTQISAPNITNWYQFVGWTATKPSTFDKAYIYPYTQGSIPGVVTYPTVETTSSNKIFYAVYKDAKPSEIKVTGTATYRTNTVNIDTLIAYVDDGTITSEYSDTSALFGYFELNGSVKNISISYSPEVTSSLKTFKQLGNRIYFLISAAANAFKITTAYTVNLSSIDSLGKSVTGSCVFKKRSILLDITGNTIYVKSYLIRESDSGSVSVTARRTDSGMSSVGLLVGEGGINHGLYSNTMNKWLVYSDQTNLNIGNNTTSTYPLGINCTNLKLTTGGNLTLSGQVQNFFKIVEVKCALDAISAHSSQAPKNYTISPGTGYTAVGIVGWSSDRYNVIPYCPRVTGATTLRAGFVNTGNGTSSSGNMAIFVLCIKGSLNGSYPS